MKLEWTKVPRRNSDGDNDPYYESQVIDVVRGIGKIRLYPETELVKHKYRPARFGKDRAYRVAFVASEGSDARISAGLLRVSEAKRAAQLWVDGKNFTTDDGRVHSILVGSAMRRAPTMQAVKYRKKPGDVRLPKVSKVLGGRVVRG